MRVWWLIVGSVVLASCGSEQHADNKAAADIGAAAEAAQGDIDTYAANTLAAVGQVPSPTATALPPPPTETRRERPEGRAEPVAAVGNSVAGEVPSAAHCAGETRVSERSDRQSGSAVWRRGDGTDLNERDRAVAATDAAPDACSAN